MKGQVSVSRHSCIYLCLILVLSGDSCSVSSLKRGISAAIQVSNVGLTTNNNDKGPPSGVSYVSTVSAGPSATEVADGRCNNEQKSRNIQPVEEGNGAPPGVVPNAYQEAQKHANNDKKKRSGLQAIANKLRRCFRKKNNKSNACKKEGAGEKKSKKSWLNRFRFLQSKEAKSKKNKYGISSKSKAIKKTRGQKKILQ